eukprot:tig00000157_g9624.t1
MDWSGERKAEALRVCAEQLDVCPRCLLRLQGSRDYQKYGSAELERPDGSVVCPLCLGVLSNVGAIANAIAEHVKASNFSPSSFSLSITTLPVITLRHCSLLLHLASLQGVPDDTQLQKLNVEAIDMKEALKWSLGDRLKAALGVDFEFKADFVISLSFEHVGSSKEIEALERTDPAGPVAERWRGLVHNSRKGIHVHSDSLQTAAKLCPLMTRREFLRAGENGEGPGCPPRPVDAPAVPVVTCGHDPIFVSGIYHKYARGLSQSPWIINGVRKSETSVQEVLAPAILAAYGCSDYRFSTAGREDVDVRMLGTGRPFVLQLIEARRTKLSDEKLRALEAIVNGAAGCADLAREAGFSPGSKVMKLAEASPAGENAGGELVEIRGLCRLPSDPAARMKAVEESKRKTYRRAHPPPSLPPSPPLPPPSPLPPSLWPKGSAASRRAARARSLKIKFGPRPSVSSVLGLLPSPKIKCVVMTASPVSDEALARANAVKDLVVQQRTPIRVLHRRSLATRPKTVHAVTCTRLNPRWLLVDVEAQGGTYIKEFVHSDRGRTEPSLGTLLGTPADIIQLDVVAIEGVSIDGDGGGGGAGGGARP